MGKQINAQLEENNKYVKAVDDFMELFMLRYFSILRKYKWFYRFTEDYEKEQKILNTLKNLTSIVISNKKQQKATEIKKNENEDFGIKKRLALLDLLLDLKDEDALTDKELNDQVNTFLFAVRRFLLPL